MNIRKITRKFLPVAMIMFAYSMAFGQAPVEGTTTGICPGALYRYTSAAGCDALHWSCQNCMDSDLDPKTGQITITGTNSDGTVWAAVHWAQNNSTGTIGNQCGTITVQINKNETPKILGSKVLCGSGQVTFTASVTSTANINGYTWSVGGTGLSPSGDMTTTANTLTLNYSNWTASSTYAPTISVGSNNTCGYKDPTGPLTGAGAIPYYSWLQVSPGNINNLLIPYTFTPGVICSTGTMKITNQPANTNVSWVSSNTNALTITPDQTNANWGHATRVNNIIGNVTVSATVSNACGSNTESTNVWLGVPDAPGPISGNTTPNIGYTEVYSSSPGNGATSYNWIAPYNSSGCTYCWSISSYNNPLNISLNVGATTGRVQVVSVNDCAPAGGGAAGLRLFPTGDPGCSPCQSPINPSPNPADKEIHIGLGGGIGEKEVILYNSSQEKVMDIFTSKDNITLPTSSVPEGTYYVHIITDDQTIEHRIIIKH